MKQAIQISILSLFVIIFSSCSKSSPTKCDENFFLYSAVSEELQDFSNAAIAYSQDPTQSNCEKYREAVHVYINALEKWETCAKEYGEVEEWRESLREAREDADQMDCQQ